MNAQATNRQADGLYAYRELDRHLAPVHVQRRAEALLADAWRFWRMPGEPLELRWFTPDLGRASDAAATGQRFSSKVEAAATVDHRSVWIAWRPGFLDNREKRAWRDVAELVGHEVYHLLERSVGSKPDEKLAGEAGRHFVREYAARFGHEPEDRTA